MERYIYYGCDVYKEIVHDSKVDDIAFYAASIAEIMARFDISFEKRSTIIETFIKNHPYSKFDIEIDYDFIELILMFLSYFEDSSNEEQYNEIYNWFANNGIEYLDQFVEYDSEDDEDVDYVPSEHEEEEDDMFDAEPTDYSEYTEYEEEEE